jgi:hypothetical protein
MIEFRRVLTVVLTMGLLAVGIIEVTEAGRPATKDGRSEKNGSTPRSSDRDDRDSETSDDARTTRDGEWTGHHYETEGEWTGHQLVEKLLGRRIAVGKVVLGDSYRARFTTFTIRKVRYVILRDGRVLTLSDLSTIVFCGPSNKFNNIDLLVTTWGEIINGEFVYAVVRR